MVHNEATYSVFVILGQKVFVYSTGQEIFLELKQFRADLLKVKSDKNKLVTQIKAVEVENENLKQEN